MLIREILDKQPTGQRLEVLGWVRTRRRSKNVAFIEINDGSSLANLQVVIDPDSPGWEHLSDLGTGASVRVAGTLLESPAPSQPVELRGEEVEVLGTVASDYPLQKKRHSFEFLREIAHLRPRTNTFGAVFRVRNVLSFAVHEFFQSEGFVYLNTPLITGSDCEGAGEMFQVTTLDIEDPPRDSRGKVDYSKDFFGRSAYLTVSGQLEAETYACALGKVYTFGPTFRAEDSNTTRHLSEFWMVEPEMAFTDLAGDMDVAERFVKHLLNAALKRAPKDMEFFDKRIAPGIMETLQSIVDADFQRMTYTDAVNELMKVKDRFQYEPGWGRDLQTEHERYLTEVVAGGPLFVTDYPKDIKAFYMRLNDDGETVAAMDLLLPKVGEIIGGSQREERYQVLYDRLVSLGLDPKDYWWYLDLRRYGTVVHSGFGLGFERMVQFVTGMANIRDVIPFPRVPGFVEF